MAKSNQPHNSYTHTYTHTPANFKVTHIKIYTIKDTLEEYS